MKVHTNVKAGKANWNHAQTGVVVRTGVKVGFQSANHVQSLVVKTGVRAGGINGGANHAQAVVKVQTGVRAGGFPTLNLTQTQERR